VKGKHYLKMILISAAAAAMPGVRAIAQADPAPAISNPGELATIEVAQLRATLFDLDKSKSPRERDEAARRLLQRGVTEPLREALRSGKSELQTPVARALSDTPNPPGELLDDLLTCLQPQMTGELGDAVCLAAANYHDNPLARAKLREFILSANVKSERLRISAVRALGTLNDKDTAQFLLQTVLKGEDPRITPLLSDAAADALAEMTGLTEYGRDLGQWNRWWTTQQAKSPQEFLNDRLAERAGNVQKVKAELAQLSVAINDFVQNGVPKTSDKDRDAYVLPFLKNTAPKFRAAGAELIKNERRDNITIGPDVRAQLREMIGDSSPEVRGKVADAIAAINDPASAQPLLAQLQRERIPDVKVRLIVALTPIKDVGSVPELIKLLNDPSFQVAEASAKALGELGPEIVKNQALAREVSNALALTITHTTGIRGATKLRERATEALIPLKDPELVQTLFSLLDDNGNNPAPVRNAAIRALGTMNASPKRQSDIAGHLADTLQRDREKGVRLEAANALGIVGGPGQAQALYKAMGDDDEGVRDAAWKSLSSLFDQFDDISLANWAETFKGSPDKQLAVNLARNKKLIQAGPNQADDLAAVQESIGTLYLAPGIDKPDEAIVYLSQALTFWDGKGPGFRTENIQNNLLDAYLRAKRYKDAVQFALARIQVKKQNQESVGRRFLKEVDELNKKNELRPALDLLAGVLTLPIEGYYKEQFILRDKDIRGRILPIYDHYRDWWIGVFA
jgi:HEAT repeat protein